MTRASALLPADFAWAIPEKFNIGIDVCDKWAAVDPDRPAIIERIEGTNRVTSYGELKRLSDGFAQMLRGRGVGKGDRVAILAPQRLETAIAHIATYKLGAIAVPLFTLFGPDALRHRLNDSGARVVVADDIGSAKIVQLLPELTSVEQVIALDDAQGRPLLEQLVIEGSGDFSPEETSSDDPALIIYTSGTTGSSKGALHAHRVLLGHLPGVEMSHGGFPREGDRMWTPADWAWIGGLLDVLLPSLHYGVPVVAHRFVKFDAAAAYDLIEACEIRNVFLPPTALKMLRSHGHPQPQWRLSLRSVASGGESLGAELIEWGRTALGVTINEFYGQTECNLVVSSCDAVFAHRPGSIGKPVPGHAVAIVDDSGCELPAGREGDIAIGAPDPVMFLRYWNMPQATAEKFRGRWLITGDRGVRDDDGFIRFVGREDDVITSAGYRIGPGEIEDCLLRHPSVASVGVIGVEDTLRTEVVTAFIVLNGGCVESADLVGQLQDHVRRNLGGHQYPRQVHFLAELPLTATGKILRRELRALAKTFNSTTS